MKQIHIVRTKVITKLESLVNEALAGLPNSEFIETFNRGGGQSGPSFNMKQKIEIKPSKS